MHKGDIMGKKNKNTPQNSTVNENAVNTTADKATEEKMTSDNLSADNTTVEHATTDKITEDNETAKTNVRKIRKPRIKHKVMSAVFTAVVIAAVVVLNIIVGILSDRYGLKADLTAEGLYSLDKQTENYLDHFLNTDISITVTSTEKQFTDSGDYFKQVNEILKKLSARSEHITLKYLELEQNPDFAAKFSEEELAENYVIVENADSGRYRVITPADYFGLDDEEALYYYYYYGYIGNSLIEQEAVSAMLYVSDDNPAKVVFTEGYNEADSKALQSLLEKNGYEIETVNLLLSDIPEDTDVVVMYAPRYDYPAEILAKLDKFLDNDGNLGKSVFYFASSDQPETPNLEGFLNDWGLSAGYSVIGHTNPEYLLNTQTYYIHLQQVEDTEFTAKSFDKGIFLGSDLRPVYTLQGSSNQLDVLMKTYDNAFLYPLSLGEDEEFDLSSAETGTYNDVVMSTKKSSDNVGRVCAIGSETLAGSALMSYANAGNRDFFLEIFDSVCGRNTGVSISPKSFSAVYFEMNANTANILAVVLCIAIPLLIITAGVVVYLRRRHR